MIVRDDGHGLRHSMARALLFCLQCPVQRLMLHGRLHLLAAMAIDHGDVLRGQQTGGGDDVLQQGPAGQRLQDFGQVRTHALALACGQDDDG